MAFTANKNKSVQAHPNKRSETSGKANHGINTAPTLKLNATVCLVFVLLRFEGRPDLDPSVSGCFNPLLYSVSNIWAYIISSKGPNPYALNLRYQFIALWWAINRIWKDTFLYMHRHPSGTMNDCRERKETENGRCEAKTGPGENISETRSKTRTLKFISEDKTTPFAGSYVLS